MIVEYFTVEAWHIKINNLKHEFRIISQQTTGGLHYPPQANQQIFKHQQEIWKGGNNQNINKLAVTIPGEVFLQQKKPTGLQAFSLENLSATVLSAKLLPLTQRTSLDPFHSSLKKTPPRTSLQPLFLLFKPPLFLSSLASH